MALPALFVAEGVIGPRLRKAAMMFVDAKLVRKGREWRRKYRIFVAEYNRAFVEKWVIGTRPADERLLGSADIQSLADMANSYDRVRQMRIIPFSQRVVIQLAVMTLLPALPLLPLVVPVADILKALAKVVFESEPECRPAKYIMRRAISQNPMDSSGSPS